MEKKNGIIALAFLFGMLLLLGCTTDNPTTASTGIQKANAPNMTSSVEQHNIIKRLEIENSPTSTMWFYGLSETGQVIFKSTVKGKVTSSGKRIEQITRQCPTSGGYGCSPELIQADGTYGSSDQYVYWFDYEDNYYQWNGKYILTTKPLRILTPTIDFQQLNESG